MERDPRSSDGRVCDVSSLSVTSCWSSVAVGLIDDNALQGTERRGSEGFVATGWNCVAVWTSIITPLNDRDPGDAIGQNDIAGCLSDYLCMCMVRERGAPPKL